MRSQSKWAVLLAFMTSTVMAKAMVTAPDRAQAGSTEAIAHFTTDAQFLSPWVAYLPESASVPSPLSYYHRISGAAGELVNTAEAQGYCAALAKASPRYQLFTIGTSEEGRDIKMLAVADEKGIAEIGRLKEITALLTDPRHADEAVASQLIKEGRPIYYLQAGPHADETGATEAMLELAYRLGTSEQPMIKRIRENTIVLINPVSNPDGRDKQVEWFYKYLKGKTNYATLPRQSPPYWSKYTMVDINRDAHQQTHETTKALHRMFYQWHPTVVHDLHEEVPILMTWNGTGPYNPNIDPITYTEFQELSFHEVQALTGFGMPGVSTWNFGEGFSHLYSESVAMNHNAIGRGYETMGNGSAETMERSISPEYTTSQWYRVMPPTSKTLLWSARDNVNYTETAVLAALDQVASHPQDYLANYHRKNYHSWRAGIDHPPYAYLIPADQGDPLRVFQMVSRVRSLNIEVERSTAEFTLADGTYPAGTYIVRLDQPYRNYAIDLLSAQKYPKEAGEPYDDVSWEFPAHYHIAAQPTADSRVRDVPMRPVTDDMAPVGGVVGKAKVYVLRDTGQESLLEARYRLADELVDIAEQPFDMGGVHYPAGSWIIPARSSTVARLQKTGQQLGLTFVAANQPPVVKRHSAPLPRLGVWVPWADTDSIGWVRYSLDQRHIAYQYVRDEDIRAGRLNQKLDIILYGNVDLELAEQIHGISTKWGPMSFRHTAQTPSLGTPAQSDDITGGIGWGGLANLQTFIEQGGLLVTLGSASMLPLEAGMVRGVRRDEGGVPRSSIGGGVEAAAAAQSATTRSPGAHLRVSFKRADHPIGYGYPHNAYVFRQNYPLYAIPRQWLRAAYCNTCLDGPIDSRGVVLEWGDDSGADFLVSGQVWGESNLIGRPAILDLIEGKGHVVAFNFNPLHRDLNRGDQRMLWNTIINWQAIVDKTE